MNAYMKAAIERLNASSGQGLTFKELFGALARTQRAECLDAVDGLLCGKHIIKAPNDRYYLCKTGTDGGGVDESNVDADLVVKSDCNKLSDETKVAQVSERTTKGLRDTLFSEIDALRSGSSTPDRAKAVANIAATILKSAEVEMDYLRLSGETKNKHLPAIGSMVLGS